MEAPLNQLYCTHCGALTLLRMEMGAAELNPCASCGERPYDPLALFAELRMSSATFRMCPTCRTANCFHPHCIRCGHAFAE